METALLCLKSESATDSALLIFGENRPKILDYFAEKEIAVECLAESREFYSYHLGESKHLMVLAGLGSASVECVLSELSMVGVKNVVLTGSCGSSYDYELGAAKILTSGKANNPGSIHYYAEEPAEVFEPDPALLARAESLGLGSASIMSSDAFYGFGCLLNEDKEPMYVGGKVSSEPKGYRDFRDLYLSGDSYLIDMEAAYVYALAKVFGLRAIAIKGISNYVPFEVGNFISREDEALDNCIRASLQLIEEIS